MSAHVTLSAPITDRLAEARERAAAAAARKARSALTPDEQELHRLTLQEAEDTAAALAAENARREIHGTALEAEARREAAGKYLVKAVDIAKRLPTADPELLPGKGVIVIRSAPPDALRDFLREAEAKERDLPAISVALVCQSIVRPKVDAPGAGEKLQAFFESDLGIGLATSLADEAAALGGAVAKQAKRGRG